MIQLKLSVLALLVASVAGSSLRGLEDCVQCTDNGPHWFPNHYSCGGSDWLAYVRNRCMSWNWRQNDWCTYSCAVKWNKIQLDCCVATPSPTLSPTPAPTGSPTTATPTVAPTMDPTSSPTTAAPTEAPTTATPTVAPTMDPTSSPTTAAPTEAPTDTPTDAPTTAFPTIAPTVLWPITPSPPFLESFTPHEADWTSFYTKALDEPLNTDHSPDGITWITKWPTWDGETIYDPTTMSRGEFTNAICGAGDTIPGLKQLYNLHQPFADIYHPCKEEVDEWNRLVINHFRRLVGYNSTEEQAKNNHCTYKRAFWSQQRKHTDYWDAKYPENTCGEGSGAHCGMDFLPDLEDQLPFLPASMTDGCGSPPAAEVVSSATKSDIPWTVKIIRVLCSILSKEGFWGGHMGPFVHREYIGLSFLDWNQDNPDSNVVFRGRFEGKLTPLKYPAP